IVSGRFETNLSPEAEFDRIWKYVNQRQYNCKESEYLGGKDTQGGKSYDLCIEDKFWPIRKNPDQKCLMYSFGIGNDWTFEDGIAKRGCEVHLFDPSK
uniref:Methyltransferase domain-containing protein n=1 Tax=Ciona savignyi TaxID=51511 RepID=H2YK65_CIOSA